MNNFVTNIVKRSTWYDKGSYNEYEFAIGKLYNLRYPRYYSGNIKDITFYVLEDIFRIETNPKEHKGPRLVLVEIEKSWMIYAGHVKTNFFTKFNLKNKGYLNKTIPCFYIKNTFVFPEQIVANNPQIYFKKI